MPLPHDTIIARSRKAASLMADAHTPFIFNEWYVAAFASDVTQALMPRTLLGKRIVMFRKQDGQVVALDDRCIHRSFPLSRGTLEHDTVVCQYHGFRYDAEGKLIEVPSQTQCPKGVGVRSYPLVERGPLLWIWLGDPNAADLRTLPNEPWLQDERWACTSGYLHHPGNYVSMHENLLDLTHLSFLHANTIGTPDYASAPFETELKDGYYKLQRSVVPTTLAPVWAESTGISSSTAARIATSEFLSPGLHRVSVSFSDTAIPEAHRPIYRIHTAHILTPETHRTMHYHIVHGRDFDIDNEALGAMMHEGLFAAFREDVEGLGALETVLDDVGPDHYEISVASDAPAVAMRRYLKKRAEAETVKE